MNKILIPTDFSEHSDYALEYASFIAKSKNCQLLIAHVLCNKKDHDSSQQKLDALSETAYLIGIDYKLILEPGHIVSKAINRVAVNHEVDLIVMGSNGISDIGEMLLGSNTENVIRNSKIDVLTIKQKMFDASLNTILFPSDFRDEAYTVFKSVQHFSEVFNAKIHLLHIDRQELEEDVDVVHGKMDQLIAHFELPENSYEKAIFIDKNQELGIINYAIEKELDLIAIGSHGKSMLSKFINESTSHNLVRDSFRPILTMRFS